MTPESVVTLSVTAAALGFVHTVLGPDHYVPFAVMARAGAWSRTKTAVVTLLCGLGHVLSSVVLGLVGIAAGAALAHLEFVESFRGDLAAWAMLAFGLVYAVWGLRRAVRRNPHTHRHLPLHAGTHPDTHDHAHAGDADHHHPPLDARRTTPWVLFIVFVLGPCEPLIPLLMYPAAKSSAVGMLFVAGVFSVVTLATMTAVTFLVLRGLTLVPLGQLERFSHALAGGAIALCGVAVLFGL